MDAAAAHKRFVAQFPKAVRYITTHREMQAGICKRLFNDLYIGSPLTTNSVSLLPAKAAALLTSIHEDVEVLNTSQSLRQMPFAGADKPSLPCLTLEPYTHKLSAVQFLNHHEEPLDTTSK